jgi:hypothetical protein
MNLDEKSVLSTMNPVYPLLGFGAVIFISIFSARRYRNTYDFKNSVRCAMTLYVILGLILVIINIPILLVIGYGICTFIFTALFSNYYFYH